MDYQTKPVSRNDIRQYAKILRKLFNVPNQDPFPVLPVLEKLPDVFPDCGFIVVEDNKLPANVMAQCTPNDAGGFTIEIRESVYEGAYEKRTGAFLGFICHEICHVFLFSIGFTPVFARCFSENELPAYCSVEWQAKALAGEVMIPFDDSIGLSVNAIVNKYHVSQAFAMKRRKLGGGGKYGCKRKTH